MFRIAHHKAVFRGLDLYALLVWFLAGVLNEFPEKFVRSQVMDVRAEQMIDAAYMQRDASMMMLVAECHKANQQLALLSETEKRAVVSLVVVGQMVAFYAKTKQSDRSVVESFEHVLNMVSPVATRQTFNLVMHVVNEKESNDHDSLTDATTMTRDIRSLIKSLAHAS